MMRLVGQGIQRMPDVDTLPCKATRYSTLRTISFLAVLGLLALFLAGPLLGIVLIFLGIAGTVFVLLLSLLAIALVFAVLGYAVWVPLRLVCPGKSSVWLDIRSKGKHLCLSLWQLSAWYFGAMLRCLAWARHKFKCLGRSTWEASYQYAWLVSRFMVELVSGALLGGMLAWIGTGQDSPFSGTVALGIALGALLGLLIASYKLRHVPS
jgi:hypothetical protein